MKNLVILITLAAFISGCGSSASSFSTLPTGQSFQQVTETINTKIDVLWVIDNSGSMQTSQNNLAANFPSFIQEFTSKGYDFKIAVTITDAYLSLPAWTPYYNQTPRPSFYEGQAQENRARFRDGVGANHSGVFVIDNNTPDLNNVFVKNVKQGTAGHGDERSFQSMKAALDSSLNANFIRPGGFLAVIFVTDEDDFSHDGTAYLDNQWNNPALHTVASYATYLDTKTLSTATNRRYSVSSLTIKDTTCLNQLMNGAQKIAQRVQALGTLTNGKNKSLCAPFADELAEIAQGIVDLANRFKLKHKPIESTIRIVVNGQVVPNAVTNPNLDGGWTYIPETNEIAFSGNYIPPQGATINVSFDPDGLSF